MGVEVKSNSANPVITDNFGIFELHFVDKEPGDDVRLILKKEGMEVVNRKELEVVLRKNPIYELQIVLCKKGERDKWVLNYYGITRQTINENYEKLLKKIEKYESSNTNERIAHLEARKKAALAHAKYLGEMFAEVNLDGAPELFKEAFNYFQQEDIEKALKVLDDSKINEGIRKALKEKQKAEEVIEKWVESYKFKARLYIANLRFDEAERYFQKAIEVAPDNFDNIFDFAYYLRKQNQHHKSITLYKKVLPLAKSERQKANIFNNLGNLYSEIDKFAKAQSSYEGALKIYRDLAGENPGVYLTYVARTLNNLGVLYEKINRPNDALLFCEQALKIYRKLGADNLSEYSHAIADIFNNLGVSYKKINHFDEALSSFEKALKIYKKLEVDNPLDYSPYVARTFNNLALLHMKKNHFRKALVSYKKALEIRQKLAADNPRAYLPSVARTLNNLGVLCETMNQFENASSFYIETLNIYKKLAAENPQAYLPSIARSYNNLGDVYSKINRIGDAYLFYQKALKIYKELAADNPQAYLPYAAQITKNLEKLSKE